MLRIIREVKPFSVGATFCQDFFAVHSVSVREHGHFTAQAPESPIDSGAINKAFFILGR